MCNVGPYGLKLAESYLENTKKINYAKYIHEGKIVIRAKGLESRFQNKKHTCYFLFQINNEMDSVIAYCSCKNGARTIGSCCHAYAILMNIFFTRNPHVRHPRRT